MQHSNQHLSKSDVRWISTLWRAGFSNESDAHLGPFGALGFVGNGFGISVWDACGESVFTMAPSTVPRWNRNRVKHVFSNRCEKLMSLWSLRLLTCVHSVALLGSSLMKEVRYRQRSLLRISSWISKKKTGCSQGSFLWFCLSKLAATYWSVQSKTILTWVGALAYRVFVPPTWFGKRWS